MAVGKSFPTLMGEFIAFLVDILASLNKEIIIILSYFYSKPLKDVLLSTQSFSLLICLSAFQDSVGSYCVAGVSPPFQKNCPSPSPRKQPEGVAES